MDELNTRFWFYFYLPKGLDYHENQIDIFKNNEINPI